MLLLLVRSLFCIARPYIQSISRNDLLNKLQFPAKGRIVARGFTTWHWYLFFACVDTKITLFFTTMQAGFLAFKLLLLIVIN